MMLAENELPLFERPAAATVLDRGSVGAFTWSIVIGLKAQSE